MRDAMQYSTRRPSRGSWRSRHPDRKGDGAAAPLPPPGTMAARFWAEGFVGGYVEQYVRFVGDLRKARASALIALLEMRFAVVPEMVRTRITGASADEIDSWSDMLMDAKTIEEITVSLTRH